MFLNPAPPSMIPELDEFLKRSLSELPSVFVLGVLSFEILHVWDYVCHK